MAKVLLVDTNFSSMPIYGALLRAGHEVYVVGGNPNDALAKISPKYYCLDYSNIDALRNFVHKEDINYLIPGCTDRSYESCVAVGQGYCTWLGDGPQAYAAINNKAIFKDVANRLGLPVPTVFSDPINCLIETAVIIKPVDSFSGKGMTILRQPDGVGLIAAMAYAKATSPTGKVIVEQFVEGQLYSHSAFLQNGIVVIDFIVQEDCTINPFAVDTSRLMNNGVDGLRSDLRDCIEALASYLGLVDGLLHTQFISNGREFWLIESTRRCPGDLYAQLIEMSSGFSYAEFYAAYFLGKVTDTPSLRWSRSIVRHTISARKEQNITNLHFLRSIHMECYVPIKSVGDRLGVGSNGRVGIIFLREDASEKFDELYKIILQKELYKISSQFDLV